VLASSGGGVVGGGHRGDGLGGGVKVALEGSQVLVAALAHQQGQGDVGVGEGGQRRVPELVKGKSGAADPPGVLLEQVFGAFVGQPSAPGDGQTSTVAGVRAGAGRRSARNSGPAWRPAMNAGQQAGGAGLKMQRAFVVQVDVLDVEGEDFLRAGDGCSAIAERR